MSHLKFEEEEFNTQFNGKTVLRLLAQAKPHWPWLVGFLLAVALTSTVESYFTFLDKRIVDEAIVARDRDMLIRLVATYGAIIGLQAVGFLAVVFFTGILGHQLQYDLRKKMFDHLQELSFSYFDKTPGSCRASRPIHRAWPSW